MEAAGTRTLDPTTRFFTSLEVMEDVGIGPDFLIDTKNACVLFARKLARCAGIPNFRRC
jgi:hypothetical protein